jgi:hypothetical protein
MKGAYKVTQLARTCLTGIPKPGRGDPQASPTSERHNLFIWLVLLFVSKAS